MSIPADAESTESAAVDAWYKEANEAKDWGMYAPSEENDTEQPAEEEADPHTQQSGPPTGAEDNFAK